ncbi:formate dehydrogenase accessory sulfurtransferase FdhD [Methanotorris igneus]|uniref:Protein FdhD n=1 Tax=Methanotorris igneus (strain DSM 5666 / JCM 11834 / Kol 5) TaxID=880724 RepID=F6BCA8_METIK|nr:formate dehydrogenase accessory sulfurtransferase FdhD [Methanotorris igneus]AEF97314.1 formate dehydrogenase family accessory protein FdhD [Methanotorris igneus Kol 5]
MITKVNAYRWEGQATPIEDYVCVEEIYELYINNKFIEELVASPNQIKELGIGHAICEGYVSKNSIINVHLDENKIYVESKEIKGDKDTEKDTQIKINVDTILKIIKTMPTLSKIWELTGGVHWAALFNTSGEVIAFSEDIGRHNAVDKVVGYAILNNINLGNCILASSGRQPYAMVKKLVNANIPIVITKSPPTDKGVKLARENNITLIGFARKNRFTIYSGKDRIVFD